MFLDIFSGFILGAVQGLTEFLPVSSSGHLILVREIFGISFENNLLFDLTLHFATSLAILIYFRKEFGNILLWFFKWVSSGFSSRTIDDSNKILFWSIILGTIPAALVGFYFQDFIKDYLRSGWIVVGTLIIGSIIFYLAERFAKQNKPISIGNGFKIGLAQTLALIPGLSRSGITISAGLFSGLNREEATRFSFMLSLPVTFGAGLSGLLSLSANYIPTNDFMGILVGGITAFVVGLWAIGFLIGYLKEGSLRPFAIYRIILALVVALFFSL